MVDTEALRRHSDVAREKQTYMQELLDILGQMRYQLDPALYGAVGSLINFGEDMLHYYRQQEQMLQEMSQNYDYVSQEVTDLLEDSIAQAQYLN